MDLIEQSRTNDNQQLLQCVRKDRHHLLFNRKEWILRKDGRALRNAPGLKIVLPRPDHEYLHRTIEPIPALGHLSLRHTRYYYEDMPGDAFQSMDNLMFAIDKANHDPKAGTIERSLGALTIEAIMLERNALKEIINDQKKLMIA